MSDLITAQFADARQKVKECLPNPDSLSKEQCARILRRYAAAIAGNFVNWMAAASVTCRSLEGRFAASENVYVEVRDNHSGMLRDFVRRSCAEPTPVDFVYVIPHLEKIQEEVSRMSGLSLTTLLGVLENSSAEFIPWLALLSRRLGNSDFTYTDVHGEADAAHANQFKWALEKEASLYANAQVEIRKSAQLAIEFLKVLFTNYTRD